MRHRAGVWLFVILSLGISGAVAAGAEPEDSVVQQEIRRIIEAARDGRGSLEEVEGYLQETIAQDPENAETLHLLALLHIERGEYAAAEAIYLQLAKRADLPEGLVAGHLGELYLLWGKLDLAEAQLKAALKHEAFPQHTAQVYRHLGEVYERTDRREAARQLYEQALEFVQGVPNEAARLTAEFKAKIERRPDEAAP
jgi:tetratricopeptide (TPR) repeat protein